MHDREKLHGGISGSETPLWASMSLQWLVYWTGVPQAFKGNLKLDCAGPDDDGKPVFGCSFDGAIMEELSQRAGFAYKDAWTYAGQMQAASYKDWMLWAAANYDVGIGPASETADRLVDGLVWSSYLTDNSFALVARKAVERPAGWLAPVSHTVLAASLGSPPPGWLPQQRALRCDGATSQQRPSSGNSADAAWRCLDACVLPVLRSRLVHAAPSS